MTIVQYGGFAAKLTYSEPMLRRALRVFVVRRVGRGPIPVAGALLAISAAFLYATGSIGMLFGFVLAALVFLAALVIAIWLAHFRNTIGKYRALRDAEAELIATEEDASFRSALGSATLPWASFTEVWGIGECWMLFTAPAQFLTIPLDGLNLDARVFLRDRLPQFRMRRPEPPAGRLTRPEVIALATQAAVDACPDSMMAQAMAMVTLAQDDRGRVWSVASQTKGMQLVVEIEDATGKIRSVRTAGVR